MSYRKSAIITLLLLAVANIALWSLALLTFHRFALLLGTATLAYTFGLRHALDADHISAIDNITRKLMQDGKRPLLVGFFFSLGHSTVVTLLSIVIVLTTARIQADLPAMQSIGGLIGTSVSAFFLLAIAGINLLVLRNILRAFSRAKCGEAIDEQDIDGAMAQLGLLGRILRPVVRLVDRSWKMYFVGFLFGLGFDTATEVGVLGISAAAVAQGLSLWFILIFPLLFTAGMCLVDTLDGILMVGAYGWAYVNPMRKLYYNLTITAASVIIAVVVGLIEALGLVASHLQLHGSFWNGIAVMGDHFGVIGVTILVLFILVWGVSSLNARLLGHQTLELIAEPVAAES